jgi:excisionase family DNA binding protein
MIQEYQSRPCDRAAYRRGDRSDVAIGKRSMDNRNSETTSGMQHEPELLRVVEASRLMSLSRTKVYEMAEKGEIPVIRIGTAVRIPRKKLLLWIEQRTVSPKDVM